MASPEISVVGVHPVDDVGGCYLIECLIVGATQQPDFGHFAQRRVGSGPPDWQVAYDEKLLDRDRTAVVADLFVNRVEKWPAQATVTFFMHHLDLTRPLTTPFGEVRLPPANPRPARLASIVYDAP